VVLPPAAAHVKGCRCGARLRTGHARQALEDGSSLVAAESAAPRRRANPSLQLAVAVADGRGGDGSWEGRRAMHALCSGAPNTTSTGSLPAGARQLREQELDC
jgi:hypothetical protein